MNIEDIVHIIEVDKIETNTFYMSHTARNAPSVEDRRIEAMEKRRELKIESLVDGKDNDEKIKELDNEDYTPVMGIRVNSEVISLENTITYFKGAFTNDELFEEFKKDITGDVINKLIKCTYETKDNSFPSFSVFDTDLSTYPTYSSMEHTLNMRIVSVSNAIAGCGRIGPADFGLLHPDNVFLPMNNFNLVYNENIPKDLIIVGRKGREDEQKLKVYYMEENKRDRITFKYIIKKIGYAEDSYFPIKVDNFNLLNT